MSQNPPPQGPPDEGNTKIIINSGSVARRLEFAAGLFDETCEAVKTLTGLGRTFPDGGKVVAMANELEDQAAAWEKKATAFQKLVLAQAGYRGPLPKCMD